MKSAKAAKINLAVTKSGAPASLSAGAQKVWAYLAPHLRQLNFLRDSERFALQRYCQYFARWVELTKILDGFGGETYETDTNHGRMFRMRPEFMVRERLEKHLQDLEDRFGMNPAYRQQILQRIAGLEASQPPLFPTEPDDNTSTDSDSEMPSAIGILGQQSTSVN